MMVLSVSDALAASRSVTVTVRLTSQPVSTCKFAQLSSPQAVFWQDRAGIYLYLLGRRWRRNAEKLSLSKYGQKLSIISRCPCFVFLGYYMTSPYAFFSRQSRSISCTGSLGSSCSIPKMSGTSEKPRTISLIVPGRYFTASSRIQSSRTSSRL